MNNKNNVASALKIGAIVIFCIGLIYAFTIASEYGDYNYYGEQRMSFTVFFSTLIGFATPCAILFGIGELIQINHDNRNYLASMSGSSRTRVRENEIENP
jgi:amino acid transporter